MDGALLRRRPVPAHPVRRAGAGVRGGHRDHALRHPRRRALALRPDVGGPAGAKTIDECPLEWFFCDGVRLDLRHKEPGERILVEDLENALDAIGYVLTPLDIVMLWTGRDKFLGTEEYFEQPGMTRESTLWLCERGIKVIGIDAYGFDRKFADMADEARRDRRRDADLGGALRRPGARVLPDREAREPRTCSRARRASRSRASRSRSRAPAAGGRGWWRSSDVSGAPPRPSSPHDDDPRAHPRGALPRNVRGPRRRPPARAVDEPAREVGAQAPRPPAPAGARGTSSWRRCGRRPAPAAARNNLHGAVHALRRFLRQARGDADHVVHEDGCYALAPDLEVWDDVAEFERLVREARRQDACGGPRLPGGRGRAVRRPAVRRRPLRGVDAGAPPRAGGAAPGGPRPALRAPCGGR